MCTETVVTVDNVWRSPARVKVAGKRVAGSYGNVLVFHGNVKSYGVQHHATWRRVLTVAVHVVADDVMSQSSTVYTQLVCSTYRHRLRVQILRILKVSGCFKIFDKLSLKSPIKNFTMCSVNRKCHHSPVQQDWVHPAYSRPIETIKSMNPRAFWIFANCTILIKF